jgi:hypothetical protein
MASEEFRRVFNGDELMQLSRGSLGLQRGGALPIEGERLRTQLNRLQRLPESGSTRQVQTQFDASRMKAARPVQRFVALEIMPFEAETQLAKVAKKRTPPGADGLPSRGLGEWN